jgi:hypothetical protein
LHIETLSIISFKSQRTGGNAMLRLAFALPLLAFAGAATAANYSAKPLQPASGRVISRDIVWSCGPDACQGATDDSRPVVLCQGLAKRTGRIESFLVDGRALTESELASCNALAKPQAAPALASQ